MGQASVPLKPVRDVPYVSSVHVDVDLIRDRNLAWCRSDLGDLDDLAASLKEHGFQLPILLTTEYEIADGARRFVAAADLLGWTTVPVKVTSDWKEVMTYFQREHWLVANGWSFLKQRWADINNLANGPFKTLYKAERSILMVENRRSSTGEKRRNGNAFNVALAEILGYPLPDILVIRQMVNYLKTIKEAYPKLHKECVAVFESAERGDMRIHRANAILMAAAHGTPPGPTKSGKSNPGRRRLDVATQRGTEISATAIANAANALAAIGGQFEWVRQVDPAVTPDVAAEAVSQIKAAVLNINRLRRLLEAHMNGDTSTQGESE